jgi:hypothetical protein
VRAAEERTPELRTARLRSAGPVVEGAVVSTVVSDVTSDDISARPARPARSPEDGPLVIEGSVLPEERRSA